jgi:hypothetical protein
LGDIFLKGFVIGSAFTLTDPYISDEQLGLEPGIRKSALSGVGDDDVPAFTGANFTGRVRMVKDGRPRIFLNNSAFNGKECGLRTILIHELIHAAGIGPIHHFLEGSFGYTDLDHMGDGVEAGIVKACGCKK